MFIEDYGHWVFTKGRFKESEEEIFPAGVKITGDDLLKNRKSIYVKYQGIKIIEARINDIYLLSCTYRYPADSGRVEQLVDGLTCNAKLDVMPILFYGYLDEYSQNYATGFNKAAAGTIGHVKEMLKCTWGNVTQAPFKEV